MTVNSPTRPAPALSVRKATPDDLHLLLQLVQSAYRGETSRKGWTNEADLVAGIRIDPASLLAKINQPRGAVLTVFLNSADGQLEEKPVACCEVVLSEHEAGDGGDKSQHPSSEAAAAAASPAPDQLAYFGLFAVDPDRQGGGLGSAVLERAEAHARDALGARRLEMTVIWTRAELIAWYERRGYIRTDEKRPWPYGDPANGVPLRDDLYFVVLVKQL